MARYQVTIAYDGTHFSGYQRQGKERTVQVEVETALRQLGWTGTTILAAGRTDTGVHASGQVIAFDLDWAHLPGALGRALNAHLPADIAVKAVQVADPAFHPRYNALSRTYQYHLLCEPERNPLRDRYSWRVWPAVSLEQLQEAARIVVGTHDFAAFGTPPRTGGSTIRTVHSARWEMHAGGVLFEVCANAFLYHMVRRMVFLQVLVGQGHLTPEKFSLAVEQAQAQTPGLASPCGLFLTEVRFGSQGQKPELKIVVPE